LLFPLGALLACAGILPWLLFALGLTDAYRPIFHSIVFRSMFHPLAEIEGFLCCFAVGFLFTILPRRTGTPPPAAWQISLALGAPTAIVICAALQKWVFGQIAWLILIGVVLEFSLRRLKSPAELSRSVQSTVWIGLALIMGAAGAILAAVGEGKDWFWLHEVGRSLLTQGLFTGLALGVAGLLPSAAQADAKQADARRAGLASVAHPFAAAVFFASFWVGQLVSVPLGFALRAAVALLIVLWLVRLPPLSKMAGARGRAARIALWMLPLGNAWVALIPESRRAGMHVIYLGCFATLVLVISTYVLPTGSDGADQRVQVSARQLGLGWGCLAVALGARILVEMDPPNFKLWLGIACAAFVGATLFTFPRFLHRIVQLIPNGVSEE
jgi:uncharacterized protein involved in response to NO